MSTDEIAHGPISRRQWLGQAGDGFGLLALSALLGSDIPKGMAGETKSGPSSSRLHHAPRAKRVVQLFMAGAASHIDLFDYKPELIRLHGQPSDFGEKVEAFQDGLGPWKRPVWNFHPYGQCGKMLSDVVEDLGSCVDDIAFIHNMVGRSGVHSAATLLQTTGFGLPGFPGMGCWISYGLGSENENLPTFVVLPDHRGLASGGVKNWDSAFLPAEHSGTAAYPGRESPIQDLFPHESQGFLTSDSDAAAYRILSELNHHHRHLHPLDGRLESRIQTYELAARMQLSAPEAFDISGEPQHILDMYGIRPDGTIWDDQINAPEEMDCFGRKCLVARRLLERGVRFVQVWSGNDNSFPRRNWDSHEDIQQDHGPLAIGMARGASALIRDLKQTGLLEDTIVFWTTEFGRLPSTQGGKGRDHNPFVFTNWLCGGGVKGGISYGPSDQWGYKPLDRKQSTEVYDVHATILHLMGIDHTQLTFRHNGIDRRLTDVHGHVIESLIG